MAKSAPLAGAALTPYCRETERVLNAVTDPVDQADALDDLVRELKKAGIWGRVGEITWARDSRGGLLIEWQPA